MPDAAPSPDPAPGTGLARCRFMPSTVIRRFAWRAGSQALDVEFVTGRVYRYHGVPEEEARAMRGAFSKGAYFNRAIRGRYQHERLPAWPPEEPDPAPV